MSAYAIETQVSEPVEQEEPVDFDDGPSMANDETGTVPGPDSAVPRRTLLAGLAGLGLAAGIGLSTVRAQDESDDEDDESDDSEVDLDDLDGFERDEIEIGETYQNFLGKLTTNLGLSDAAQVDTAIRDALIAMVDEVFADGDISQNLATDLKERIATSEAPIAVAAIDGMRHRRIVRWKRRRDKNGASETDDDSSTPASDSTPAL